ncbi:MAG: chloramphenicol acetyltransferase [Ruminococcus sp.]|nr:chloramphenicol acetyltransferase [Ruminococcus sp.]
MKNIDPKLTKRADAFELWMNAPMPMVTLFKTLDVTKLVRYSRKHNYKFNMLMCWCIGKAASQIDEFYMLPVDKKLMQFDKLAVNTVVMTKNKSISTCDIPFTNDLKNFSKCYLKLTKKVHDTCSALELGEEYMVIGTSALVKYELDGIVNIYAGFYNNPFMTWSKYKKKIFKITLPISFQFHHTQMDGEQAAYFLELLQAEINSL